LLNIKYNTDFFELHTAKTIAFRVRLARKRSEQLFNFFRRKKKIDDKPSNDVYSALVDTAIKKHGDDAKSIEVVKGTNELELKAFFYATMINDQHIHSDKVALQFILEELDAASQGNDEAVSFVNNSGFKENDYFGAMNNSFEEVDGPDGPQQILLALITSVDNMDERVKFRIDIVDNIMQKRKLGKYSAK